MASSIWETTRNRCLKCGNSQVRLQDCGYTTFNPGTATCTQCGAVCRVEVCGDPPELSLKRNWDVKNPKPEVAIRRIDERIDCLKVEKKRLKKLFKI